MELQWLRSRWPCFKLKIVSCDCVVCFGSSSDYLLNLTTEIYCDSSSLLSPTRTFFKQQSSVTNWCPVASTGASALYRVVDDVLPHIKVRYESIPSQVSAIRLWTSSSFSAEIGCISAALSNSWQSNVGFVQPYKLLLSNVVFHFFSTRSRLSPFSTLWDKCCTTLNISRKLRGRVLDYTIVVKMSDLNWGSFKYAWKIFFRL